MATYRISRESQYAYNEDMKILSIPTNFYGLIFMWLIVIYIRSMSLPSLREIFLIIQYVLFLARFVFLLTDNAN